MKKLLALAALALLFAGCSHAAPPASTPPAALSSKVQQTLANTGVKIIGSLDAPPDYHGFVGMYRGRRLSIYVTPDGKHLVVGTLYELGGRNLTATAMRAAAERALGHAQWKELGQSTWISTGNVASARVVYAFMDTECPYCHKLWLAAQPWLAAHKVELRIIPVAVISPKSVPGAATVLQARDQLAAWRASEKHFGEDRSAVRAKATPATLRILRANNDLMTELGFFGTPGVVYKDANGKIHTAHGLPRSSRQLEAIFGR